MKIKWSTSLCFPSSWVGRLKIRVWGSYFGSSSLVWVVFFILQHKLHFLRSFSWLFLLFVSIFNSSKDCIWTTKNKDLQERISYQIMPRGEISTNNDVGDWFTMQNKNPLLSYIIHALTLHYWAYFLHFALMSCSFFLQLHFVDECM